MINTHGEHLQLKEKPIPEPSDHEVLVRIYASGVCHTDVHAVDGDWSLPTILPLIPGHEGVGIVVKTGKGVSNLKENDRVGIPWLGKSCGSCEYCDTGREPHCNKQVNTGYSVHGCFAEYTIANADFVVKIPEGILTHTAAPILCAGVTTWVGIKNTGVCQGQYLTIIGSSGGLGHMAVQYAVAIGVRVIAVDVGQDKRDFSTRLGAEVAFDATDSRIQEKIVQYTNGGSHGVLCLAASTSAIESAVGFLRRCGTLVMIALPKGKIALDVCDIVLRGLTVKGSLVGTRADLKEALEFVDQGKVVPHIEVESICNINKVFDRLRKGQVSGRIVLDFS